MDQEFRPHHLPIARLRELYAIELEKKKKRDVVLAQMVQEAKEIIREHEAENLKLFEIQTEQLPKEIIQELVSDVHNKMQIVAEDLPLNYIASSVEYAKTLGENQAHKEKALKQIDEMVVQMQPKAVENKYKAIKDLIANSENSQAALRSELASVIESKRRDACAFDAEMRKLNRTVNKLDCTEQLARDKIREMKHFIGSQGPQMLAEKSKKIENLMAKCGKQEPAPVRLKPYCINDEEIIELEDERAVTDEDYDGDED